MKSRSKFSEVRTLRSKQRDFEIKNKKSGLIFILKFLIFNFVV